jgi:hypothetical protein
MDVKPYIKRSMIEKGVDKEGNLFTQLDYTIEPLEEGHVFSGDLNEISLERRKELRRRFAILWERLLAKAQSEPNDVSLVALAEALKVRIISKSGAARSMVLKNMQKWMHSRMRKHPMFTLIGETISEEFLTERLRIPAEDENPDWYEGVMSGDYTAATNEMLSVFSDSAGNAVCDVMGLDEQEREIFIDHLVNHWIEDPDSPKGELRVLSQKRGQLMGSIISFPILCIVNATIVRMSYELGTGKIWKLIDLPACVNGDDVVLAGKRQVYDTWKVVAAYFGMQESIGKTFWSDKFCQMNSMNFRIQPTGKLIASKFINWGLIKGMGRSENGDTGLEDDTNEVAPPGHKYRELMRLAPASIHKDIHKLYVEFNADMLSRVLIPWYLPTWLGGLGLTGVMEPSNDDLAIANGFIRLFSMKRRGLALPTGGDGKGISLLPKDIGQPVKSWLVRDLASKRIPEPFQTWSNNTGTDTYARALFEEGVNLLFDSTVSLKTLFPKTTTYIDEETGEFVELSGEEVESRANQPSRISQALRHNRRVWKRSYKDLYRAPIKYKGEELEKFKIYESYSTDPNDKELDLMDYVYQATVYHH